MAADLGDPASLHPALDGTEAVFLLPGYAGLPAVLALAHAEAFGDPWV